MVKLPAKGIKKITSLKILIKPIKGQVLLLKSIYLLFCKGKLRTSSNLIDISNLVEGNYVRFVIYIMSIEVVCPFEVITQPSVQEGKSIVLSL